MRGTNFTTAGIEAAIEAIAGWPARDRDRRLGRFGGTPHAVQRRRFQVTFGGPAPARDALTAVARLVRPPVPASSARRQQGGPIHNGGHGRTDGNHAPVVTVPGRVHDPAAHAVRADRQRDRRRRRRAHVHVGAERPRRRSRDRPRQQPKLNGPLFRQFGTAAIVTPEDTLQTPSPGENTVGTDPTRVFPDLAQILADNTNAATGTCPDERRLPTPALPPIVDCYSEFLPTAAYVGVAGNATALTALPADRARRRPGGGGVGTPTRRCRSRRPPGRSWSPRRRARPSRPARRRP